MAVTRNPNARIWGGTGSNEPTYTGGSINYPGGVTYGAPGRGRVRNQAAFNALSGYFRYIMNWMAEQEGEVGEWARMVLNMGGEVEPGSGIGMGDYQNWRNAGGTVRPRDNVGIQQTPPYYYGGGPITQRY